MEKFLKKQMEMLDRGIVATPTEEYLESFAKANGGSKNYGYKLALQVVARELLIDLKD